MRARTDPPDPRDVLGLQHAEAVVSLVPRFALDVQAERPAAPTPWTSRSARKPAVAVIVSLRSVSPAIVAMRTARRRVARRVVSVRSRPPGSGIAAARKAASIIAISSARIACA